MAFTILARVGEDNQKAVLATTILSYSISSVITGLVFFGMGACRLGSLIGFFPRHILIGCIGGVGWFLFATGLEVSARLNGELQYNIPTLKSLFRIDTVFLWMIPLLLAVLLMICQRWIKHPLFVPCYFLIIPAIFYIFVAAIPDLHLDDLRKLGWVFDLPAASTPFYHFYTLYGTSSSVKLCQRTALKEVSRFSGSGLGRSSQYGTRYVRSDLLRRLTRAHKCPSSWILYRGR